ncbi:MAG: hypothetical protein OXC82_12785, partial [Rhodobacteraceae bacterium]|nr:hypothetical protein [Paracoccaceae bacterium]
PRFGPTGAVVDGLNGGGTCRRHTRGGLRTAAPVAMAFILPEGGRGIFKPTHHRESHGLSLLGKQP